MTKNIQLVTSLVFLILITACSSVEKPEFVTMKNIKFQGFNINKQSVTIQGDAVFYNSNPVGVDISGIELDVYLNEVLASHISQGKKAQMKPNAEFVLPLNMEVSTKNLNKDFGNMLKRLLTKPTITYTMEGHLVGSYGDYGLKLPIHYVDSTKL